MFSACNRIDFYPSSRPSSSLLNPISAESGIYALVAACGMGFPWNSDITLITASVLAALGYFDLKILVVLAFLALMTGDTVIFFVGRRWGKSLLRIAPFKWIFKPEKIAMAEKFLNTKGEKFLFIVRFLPLIRTPLFFSAGSLQVKPRTFYIMDATATLIYLPTLMGISYYASENIDQVIATLKKFQFGLLGLVVLAAIYITYQKRARKSREKGTLLA